MRRYLFAPSLFLIVWVLAFVVGFSVPARAQVATLPSGGVARAGITNITQTLLPLAEDAQGTSAINTNSTAYAPTGVAWTATTAGRYVVITSLGLTVSNTATVTVALFGNGTLIAGTERDLKGDGGTLSGTTSGTVTQLAASVLTAGQLVDVRWKVSSGLATATMGQRSVVALQVQP